VDNFEPIKYLKTTELTTTQDEVGTLASEFKTKNSGLAAIEKSSNPNDVFSISMTKKFADMEEKVDSIKKLLEDVDSSFTALITDYGEDKKSCPTTQQFFTPICTFMVQWESCEKDIIAAEAAAKKKIEDADKEKAEAEKKAKAAALAERRARLEEKKKMAAAGKDGPKDPEKTPEAKQADTKEEQAQEALDNVLGTGDKKETFKARRLRRQDTLREKRAKAAENAAKA